MEFFSNFDLLNIVFHSGCRLIDIFSSCISIHNTNHSFNESKATHYKKLDEIILESSSDPKTVVIISDISIKNNIAFFISHIHFFDNTLKKTLYHAINVMPMEAKLFTIQCNINQIVQIQHALYIIVIANTIHTAKKIFDPSIYLYQQQTIAISKDLRVFFSKHKNKTIEFWDFSNNKWYLHTVVDKETRKFNLVPLYPTVCYIITTSENRTNSKGDEC